MKFYITFLSFVLLHSVSLGTPLDDGWPAERNTENSQGADSVFKLIDETINKATKGITTSELRDAAKQIKALSDSLTGEVSEESVKSLIKDIALKINSTSAISAILEDYLSYESKRLNDFLDIWMRLVQKGKYELASESSVDITLVAISTISTSIQTSLTDVDNDILKKSQKIVKTDASKKEETVIYYEPDEDKPKSVEKRRLRMCCGICFSCSGRR